MELFKKEPKLDFLQIRKLTCGLSAALCIVAIYCITSFGLNLSLEFTGGLQVEVRFAEAISLNDAEKILTSRELHVNKSQYVGSTHDILFRLAVQDEHAKKQVHQQLSDLEVLKIEYVGSEIGQQLIEQGTLAVLAAVIAMMIYIAMRFEYRFAISAAAALLHDVLIVIGIFALFNIEFDLATLAAILSVLGYSLNDTIVIFDRVRENFKILHKKTAWEIMNISINQTLSRTLMTSWLTLLVVIALLSLGGPSLFGFSLAMCIGIVVGTYSSIFVAGVLAIQLGLSRKDLLPSTLPQFDDLP